MPTPLAQIDLASGFLSRLGALRRLSDSPARRLVSQLPAYQVALWPDGWLLEPDGGVRVQDTHAMAEARRWHAMAERNQRGRAGRPLSGVEITRAMRLHGLSVPRVVIEMAGCRFPSEQVASVAFSLVAGDWIGERRRALLASPEQALAQHALAWSGSRHKGTPDPRSAERLLEQLVAQCIDEALLPRAGYRVGCSLNDGYGVCCCRCSVEVDLDSVARARAHDVLAAALIPWNRVLVRDARAIPLIALWLRPPLRQSSRDNRREADRR
jgi:hypothetical protein